MNKIIHNLSELDLNATYSYADYLLWWFEQRVELIYTVVQPDLSVICDETKLDDKGCIGAPDLIVEILSPGNSKKDLKIKYQLYEEAGVKEYWIVFPSEMVLQQFVLNEKGQYELKSSYAEDEKFHAFIFPDLVIDLAEVFKD